MAVVPLLIGGSGSVLVSVLLLVFALATGAIQGALDPSPAHRTPRSSEALEPVKMAVSRTGLQRPISAPTSAFISSRAG